jgi:hypothetical protein
LILSDHGIKDALKNKELIIDPEPEDGHYDPSSVDLLLGDDFQMWSKPLLSSRLRCHLGRCLLGVLFHFD